MAPITARVVTPKGKKDKNNKKGGNANSNSDDEILYLYLTKEILDELEKCNGDAMAEISILAESFELTKWQGDLSVSIQLNLYQNVYIFAKENKFSISQTNVFFSLIKSTLDKLIDNIFKSLAPIDELKGILIRYLKEGLDGNQPATSSTGEKFNLDTCNLITEYASKTLFQHFNLYRWVFLEHQDSEQLSVSKVLQFPNDIDGTNTQQVFTLLDLKDARSEESVLKEQEEERIRIANLDTFPSDADIFDSLTAAEIKKVAYDTVVALLEQTQIDAEKSLHDAKVKMATQKMRE